MLHRNSLELFTFREIHECSRFVARHKVDVTLHDECLVELSVAELVVEMCSSVTFLVYK